MDIDKAMKNIESVLNKSNENQGIYLNFYLQFLGKKRPDS